MLAQSRRCAMQKTLELKSNQIEAVLSNLQKRKPVFAE